MIQAIQTVLVARYPRRDDRLRAYFLLSLQAAVTLVIILAALVLGPLGNVSVRYPIILMILSGIALSVGLLWTQRREAASALLIAILLFGAVMANLNNGLNTGFDVVGVALVIISGGFLLGERGLLITSTIAIVAVAMINIVNPVAGAASSLVGELVLALVYAAIAGVTLAFLRVTAASRQEGEMVGGAERIKLAELTTRLTSLATQRSDLDEALYTALNLILNSYAQFYHVQVFIIDDDGVQARLSASTGAVGRRLLAEGHELAVGSFSVIGQATFKGEPVLAIANDPNTIHRPNPLLPETQVEIAFPMQIEDRIIGALDLQSKELLEMTAVERFTFQTLANSLSLVIDNIRQFDKAQESVRENQRLAEQSRNALREVERLNQRLIGRAWSDYLKSYQHQLGIDFDFETYESQPEQAWTSTLADAAQTNSVVQSERFIALPLRVSGHVVGALEFEMEDPESFSPEDLELIQDVSERFGLSVENMRLVDESQRIAQRETLINEITSRLQGSNDVETILNEALRSISETLQASKVAVRLGVPMNEEN